MAARGFTLASVTHRGRRSCQEDACLVAKLPGGVLLAVADGMGGHASGDVASRLAVEALTEAARTATRGADPARLLDDAAARANQAILAHAAKQPQADGLGTTLVAAAVTDKGVIVGHVGDSRAFIVTEDDVTQVTRDHSAVQDSLDRGTLTEAEAAHSPYRHAILRHLGDTAFAGLERTPAHGAFGLEPGSIVLLTSDGAHGHLTPADLLGQCAGTRTLDDALRNLIRLAYHRGSDDNLTLVACEVGRYPRSRVVAQTPRPLPEPAPHRSRRWWIPAALILLTLLTLGGLVHELWLHI